MGRTSCLSPVDIQIGRDDDEEGFSLINYEKYMDFIEDSCERFELEGANKTEYVKEMSGKLLEKVHPLQIGEWFRLKDLARFYGEVLLTDYMFKSDSRRKDAAKKILENLTVGAPDHATDIDLAIAQRIGLKAVELDQETWELSKKLVDACIIAKRKGHICDYISKEDNYRKPFYLPLPLKTKGDTDVE